MSKLTSRCERQAIKEKDKTGVKMKSQYEGSETLQRVQQTGIKIRGCHRGMREKMKVRVARRVRVRG